MKRTLITLSLAALLLVSCKDTKKQENGAQTTATETQETTNTDGQTVITGKFIATEKAAVINGLDEIYGVVLDSMSSVLTQKVEPLKRKKYDMVPVVVKGKVSPNPMKDGWDKVIKITKIIRITKPKSETAITINSVKTKE